MHIVSNGEKRQNPAFVYLASIDYSLFCGKLIVVGFEGKIWKKKKS